MGHVGGKLLLFQAALPTLGAGKLKPGRDNPHLYNSEREPSLRNPEDPFFKRYAGEASSRQMTLDVFLAANGFADLASLAAIPRYTCGQVSGGPGRCAAGARHSELRIRGEGACRARPRAL
jgi:protein transport protein SEC24